MTEKYESNVLRTTPTAPPYLGGPLSKDLFDMDRVWRIMDGAIDVHVHGGPEAYVARVADELELAIEACENGMGAIVFKCHSAPSSRSAKIVQNYINHWAESHNKQKIDIFGGVVLNYAVGGLNPEAVEVNYRLGGKYVWLPTMDSNYKLYSEIGTPGRIETLDESGFIVPKLKEILDLIAQTDMVLCITHQCTKERFAIIDAAKKIGVKRIELAHPDKLDRLSIEEMKMIAGKGVYIGLYSMNLAEPGYPSPSFDPEFMLQIIREVDTRYLVAGTDAGAFIVTKPVESMRRFITWMLHFGIPDETVEKIVKINAKKLLYQ